MSREVWYVAAPVAPTANEIAQQIPASGRHATMLNIRRGGRWVQWLRRNYPEKTFIAPWISDLLTGGDDSDPSQREAGLVDCEATARLCAGIVMTGGRIGTGGARERAVAKRVVDLTFLGAEPPTHGVVVIDWKGGC